MLDRCDATRQPVGMVDNELAKPNPRKTEVLSSDYSQGKQRKETGVRQKAPTSLALVKVLPITQEATTTRGNWRKQAKKIPTEKG